MRIMGADAEQIRNEAQRRNARRNAGNPALTNGTAEAAEQETAEFSAPAGLAAREGINGHALMMMEFAAIRWIVQGYVVEGLTILAGAPKLGKSWLMLGIAIAVALGAKALGCIQCEPGDVLYLALEDNPRRLKARLKQMNLTAFPGRITFVTHWPTVDDGCIREIEAWIHSVPNPRLIVIDVLARVRGSTGTREAQYEADYRNAAVLQELAGKYGLAIVAVHHTRKVSADDPFDEVSGTRGLTGAADSVLVLKRNPNSQFPILYGRGRDMEEVETAIEFEPETGLWFARGNAAEMAKTAEQQAIIEVLGRAVDPLSPTDIAAVLNKTRSNVNHLLTKLLLDGKVSKHPKGMYTLHPIHSVHSGVNQ